MDIKLKDSVKGRQMVTKATAKNIKNTTKNKKLSKQYKLCISFVIINCIYFICWLTAWRVWASELFNLWPLAIYVVVNLFMCIYALVQPKVQNKYFDIILVVGIVPLFLMSLLNLLAYSVFSVRILLAAANIFVLLSSLILLFARITHRTVSHKMSLMLIIGTLILELISFIWTYSTFWPRSPYRGFSDGQYIFVLITVGISGLFWVAREVGWVIVMRILEKDNEIAEPRTKTKSKLKL